MESEPPLDTDTSLASQAQLSLAPATSTDQAVEKVTCPVCFYTCDADQLVTLPCRHQVHTGCMLLWLNYSCVRPHCPICRQQCVSARTRGELDPVRLVFALRMFPGAPPDRLRALRQTRAPRNAPGDALPGAGLMREYALAAHMMDAVFVYFRLYTAHVPGWDDGLDHEEPYIGHLAHHLGPGRVHTFRGQKAVGKDYWEFGFSYVAPEPEDDQPPDRTGSVRVWFARHRVAFMLSGRIEPDDEITYHYYWLARAPPCQSRTEIQQCGDEKYNPSHQHCIACAPPNETLWRSAIPSATQPAKEAADMEESGSSTIHVEGSTNAGGATHVEEAILRAGEATLAPRDMTNSSEPQAIQSSHQESIMAEDDDMEAREAGLILQNMSS